MHRYVLKGFTHFVKNLAKIYKNFDFKDVNSIIESFIKTVERLK